MSEKRMRAKTTTPGAAYHLGQLHAYQTIAELARLHFDGLPAICPGLGPSLDGFQRALQRGVKSTWAEAIGYVYGETGRETAALEPEPVVYFDAAREIPRLVPGRRQAEATVPIVITPPIRVITLADLDVRERIEISDPDHLALAAKAQLMAAIGSDIRSATSVDDVAECRDRLRALISFHVRVGEFLAQASPIEPGPVAEVVRTELAAVTRMLEEDLAELPDEPALDELADFNVSWAGRANEVARQLDSLNQRAFGGRDLGGCDLQVCLRSEPSMPPALLLVGPRPKLAGRRIGAGRNTLST